MSLWYPVSYDAIYHEKYHAATAFQTRKKEATVGGYEQKDSSNQVKTLDYATRSSCCMVTTRPVSITARPVSFT
jgi:hypothetical protein